MTPPAAPPRQLQLVEGLFWGVGGLGVLWLGLAVVARTIGASWAPPIGAALLGLALAIPFLITARGIRQRRLWARWVGIALSLMAVPFFPAGTLLGLFSLGSLLSRKATDYFGGEFM